MENLIEWWFGVLDPLATDYCAMRSGGVDQCKWHLTAIFVVPFIAIPMGLLLSKLRRK